MTTRPARDAIYWLAVIAAAVTIALTGAAFWLSYEHLHGVADAHGLQHDQARAWAWPATLDAFIVLGEVLILRGSLRGRIDWWAIALAAAGSGGSIALNVAGVYREGAPVLDYVVAGVPPVAALLAFGALMQQIHGVLAARLEVTRPQHVICTGRSGVLPLRVPRSRPAPPPLEPAGSIGSPVDDIDTLLSAAHAPVVYLIRNGSRVKIGTSRNLRNRVAQMCLRADDLELVLHGDASLERDLHERFSASRVGNTEWFERVGPVATFINNRGQDAPDPVDSSDTGPADNSAPDPVDSPEPDTSVPVDSSASAPADNAADGTPTAPRQQRRRTGASSRKRPKRRPLDEWVELAGPIFHAEFERLRRNPTAHEFATAIKRAGYGAISDSTAKNIRTEILDRAELPALD